jgi:hypothetical protein
MAKPSKKVTKKWSLGRESSKKNDGFFIKGKDNDLSQAVAWLFSI